ncbi:hypothetical protein Mapa_008090 [Marchantia paleacea]|nr:hypothetical protein Mapa_008090 [Marchantia paleacea]
MPKREFVWVARPPEGVGQLLEEQEKLEVKTRLDHYEILASRRGPENGDGEIASHGRPQPSVICVLRRLFYRISMGLPRRQTGEEALEVRHAVG